VLSEEDIAEVANDLEPGSAVEEILNTVPDQS